MLYGHHVHDAISCHRSLLFRNWHDDNLQIEKKAAKRKEKLEKYYNRGAKPLKQLKVGDPVSLTQNDAIDMAKLWNAVKRNDVI